MAAFVSSVWPHRALSGTCLFEEADVQKINRKGNALNGMLAMIERGICDAFFRREPFEGRSQYIKILVAIKPQVFS